MENPELELARRFVERTATSVFLTGKAGTGKTTFLRELRARSPKRMIVLAPTGVAAINAGGVTIHSFFQLAFAPYVPESERGIAPDRPREAVRFSRQKIAIIKSIDLLVIDEISMVRADVLDAVSDVLRRFRDRRKPFGGVQLLLIGDVRQLAPVVRDEEWALLRTFYDSPFFFDSKALKQTDYVGIELQRVYRQSDGRFVELLNRVRDGRVDRNVLDELNRRYVPGFRPGDDEGYITLTSHNHTADAINERRLAELDAPSHTFEGRKSRGPFPNIFIRRTVPHAEERGSGHVRQERSVAREALLQRADRHGHGFGRKSGRGASPGRERPDRRRTGRVDECEIRDRPRLERDFRTDRRTVRAVSAADGLGDYDPQESGSYFRPGRDRCRRVVFARAGLCRAEPVSQSGRARAQFAARRALHRRRSDCARVLRAGVVRTTRRDGT